MLEVDSGARTAKPERIRASAACGPDTTLLDRLVSKPYVRYGAFRYARLLRHRAREPQGTSLRLFVPNWEALLFEGPPANGAMAGRISIGAPPRPHKAAPKSRQPPF